MAHNQATSSLLPIVGRVFWMMLGPLALVLHTFAIVNVGSGWFTLADFGFLTVLGAMILARWLEFLLGNPQTATGEPANWAHFRRFGLATISLGLSVWVISNLIGNHWLAR